LNVFPHFPRHPTNNKWFERDGFVKTSACTTLFDKVQACAASDLTPGIFVKGPMGIGKSSTVYYCVAEAWNAGWMTVYIPRCDLWIDDSDNPGKPYAYFLEAVIQGLTSPHLKESFKSRFHKVLGPVLDGSWLNIRELNCGIHPLHRTFHTVIEMLQTENQVPVLLAFDEVQALFYDGLKPVIKYLASPFIVVCCMNKYPRVCVLATGISESGYNKHNMLKGLGVRF
jgi:hypothetical protein